MKLVEGGVPIKFLSTPSARRATIPQQRNWASLSYFYPRPPRGGRHARRSALSYNGIYFYPRPPRGGRQYYHNRGHLSSPISIHALREEGDAATLTLKAQIENFYPRPPRGGRQDDDSPQTFVSEISIHALREEGDAAATRS